MPYNRRFHMSTNQDSWALCGYDTLVIEVRMIYHHHLVINHDIETCLGVRTYHLVLCVSLHWNQQVLKMVSCSDRQKWPGQFIFTHNPKIILVRTNYIPPYVCPRSEKGCSRIHDVLANGMVQLMSYHKIRWGTHIALHCPNFEFVVHVSSPPMSHALVANSGHCTYVK